MRELKYRGYDTQCKCMGLVTRVDFNSNGYIDGVEIIFYRDFPRGNEGKYYVHDDTPIKTKDIKLMCHIGILDKNNKSIYEGDIVKTKWQACGVTNWEFDFMGEVIYSAEHCAFRILSSDGHLSRQFYSDSDEKLLSIEVIGNIYENPELSEGDKHDN